MTATLPRGRAAALAMRLEVYGSPVVNWARVIVRVQGDAASFEVRPGSDFAPLPDETR